MDLDLRQKGSVSILVLSGAFSTGSDRQFREAIDTLIEDGRTKILIDFERVSFMDSCGIGELVAAHRTVKTLGGALKILSPTQRIQDSLEVTKLLPIFETFHDEAEAVASF